MIPEPLLRWATSGAFDENYLELLLLRQQVRDAMDAENMMVMAIHKESDRRLELLQNVYSSKPYLRDIIDDILEKNR